MPRGRPPIPLGSHGTIALKRLVKGKWRARTRYRRADGRIMWIERFGGSSDSARYLLQQAIASADAWADAGTITPESTIAEVAHVWLAELGKQVEAETLAPNSARLYTLYWTNHIRTALGALRCREVKVSHCQRFLDQLEANGVKSGPRRTIRIVLRHILTLAVTHDAMADNPVDKLRQIKTPTAEKKVTTTLTIAEMDAWFAFLAADVPAQRAELGDLSLMFMATGIRMGELLAVRIEDIDIEQGILPVAWHLIRVKGEGLIRKASLKSGGDRDLRLPSWAVTVIRQRVARLGTTGALFPSTVGTYRDPSNTSKAFRAAVQRAAEAPGASPVVKSHDFRRFVLTTLLEGGLTQKDVSDQAGHSSFRTTEGYMGRKRIGDRALRILEGLRPDDDDDGSGVPTKVPA